MVIREHRVVEAEKKLGEIVSKQWDLWKIVFTATLAVVVTIATNLIMRTYDSRDASRKVPASDPQRPAESKK